MDGEMSVSIAVLPPARAGVFPTDAGDTNL
jgi:hypothetical protein